MPMYTTPVTYQVFGTSSRIPNIRLLDGFECRQNQVVRFLRMRESGKGNSGSGVSIWLGSNGSQKARLGHQIFSQYRWEIVAMAVLGSQIGVHTQSGIRAK